MRVCMKALAAGPAGVRAPGQVVEVTRAEGEALVAGGYAEEVPRGTSSPLVKQATLSAEEQTVTGAPESAVAPPREHAVGRRPRRK